MIPDLMKGRNISSFAKTKFLYSATNVNLDVYSIYIDSDINEELQVITGKIYTVTVDTLGVIINTMDNYVTSLNEGASYEKFLNVILSAVIPNTGGMTVGDILGNTLTANAADCTQIAINAGYLAP